MSNACMEEEARTGRMGPPIKTPPINLKIPTPTYATSTPLMLTNANSMRKESHGQGGLIEEG